MRELGEEYEAAASRVKERIAKKRVNHYLTDFYNYDKPIIERQEKAEYIWIVRECGTWLYRWEDAGEIHDYYCDDKEVDFS